MPSRNLQNTINNEQPMQRLAAEIANQHAAALHRYNRLYNNLKYLCAVAGRDEATYGCALQDAALALCGSPYVSTDLYTLLTTYGDNPHALEFLASFCSDN